MTRTVYNRDPLAPWHRIAALRNKRALMARRARAAGGGLVMRPAVMPSGYYDITGSVGQGAGARVIRPAFVMPYPEPGLGEMWSGHLEDQQLGGLFKGLKKSLKKVVKSKAFKYAAVAAAAYYGGPAAAKGVSKLWAVRNKIVAARDAQKAAEAAQAPPLNAPGSLAVTPSQAPTSSNQPTLPPGYYWDAAGNVHDQAGNVYDTDGNLISAAAAPAQGGFYEAASTADPGGTIPGEWPSLPTKTPSAPLLAGFDVGSIVKIAVPVVIGFVALKAMSGGRRGR